MKKLFIVIMASLPSLTAFAQGRVSFQNNSLRLLYYQDMPGHTDGEAVYAANSGPYTFMADLYMGTSSDLLSLISSTTLSAFSPGKWSPLNVIAPFPRGASVFIITQIRDATQPAPEIWTPFTPFVLGGPYGVSQEFQFVLGTSPLTYPPMYLQGTSPGTGNWAPGTVNMDAVFVGCRGAIAVGFIPEPSIIGLASLAGLVIFLHRRRN